MCIIGVHCHAAQCPKGEGTVANTAGRPARAPQIRVFYRNSGQRAVKAAGNGLYVQPRPEAFDEPPGSAPAASPAVHQGTLSAKQDHLDQLLPVGADAVGYVAVPYVVQPGDTLFSIARRFTVPLERLRSANAGVVDDTIFSGQILDIPLREPTWPLLPAMYEPLVVQPGDTLETLAERFGISPEAIDAANPAIGTTSLIPGTVVFIPVVEPAPPSPLPAALYIARAGDTLTGIAAAFDRPLADIRAANPQVGDDIFPGEILVIPAGRPPTQPVFHRSRYVIQPGDTLASIAEQFMVPIQRLQEVNVFIAPIPGLVIAVPMQVQVPMPPPTQAGFPGCIAPPFGRRLNLGDDDSVFVEFPPGLDFKFFGLPVGDGVYINANGNLTFQQGDPGFIAGTDAFLEGPPRIAGLWVDLAPLRAETPGGVFVTTVADQSTGKPRLVITWDRVPLFAARDVFQTFQISLNPDQSISMCYFDVTPLPATTARTLIGVGGGSETPTGNVFLFDGDLNPRRLGPSTEPTPAGPLTQRTLLLTFDERLANYRLRFT